MKEERQKQEKKELCGEGRPQGLSLQQQSPCREEDRRQKALWQEVKRDLENIRPVSREAMEAAARRLDALAKPPGSLGQLETIARRLAGILGTENSPGRLKKTSVIIFCADNGVVSQGVASAPQSVTRAQAINFTRGMTGVCALADSFGSQLMVVDVGMRRPAPAALYTEEPFPPEPIRQVTGERGPDQPEPFRKEPAPGIASQGDAHESRRRIVNGRIVDRRTRPGTEDISRGPAMTEGQALQAVHTGMEMIAAAKQAGYEMVGIGEMGIGNTTTSAAVLSCLTGEPARRTCGRGGGLTDTGLRRKQEIVDGILREWQSQIGDADAEAEAQILGLLARAGGLDLAAMTGAFLGAAAHRMPVVIDGFISAVAALAAARIRPQAADYMFASHSSAEPGYRIAIRKLEQISPGLKPFLSLDMRLGEGSGCPMAMAIIRSAWEAMQNMATFEEAEINDDYLAELRTGGRF